MEATFADAGPLVDDAKGTLIYWRRFWATSNSSVYYGRVHYYTGGDTVLCGQAVPRDNYRVATHLSKPNCKRCLKSLAAREVR